MPVITACNKSAQTRRVVDDHLAVIPAICVPGREVKFCPAVHDDQLFEIFWLKNQAPLHWYRDFGPEHATHPLLIWESVLFAAIQ
ncbi:hypothetical protein TNCV_3214281 [Trichonephila clavipes]|nr:hypothetical protein TNCV_3214281 [Trichonephila clavipes]